MILSEKLVEVISVSTPLTFPIIRFDGAGKGSSRASFSAIFYVERC